MDCVKLVKVKKICWSFCPAGPSSLATKRAGLLLCPAGPAMDNLDVSQKQIKSTKKMGHHNKYIWKFKLDEKLNQIFFIKEEQFETLYIVVVYMKNNNNEFRKMFLKKANDWSCILHKLKSMYNVNENQGWPQDRQYKYEVIFRK